MTNKEFLEWIYERLLHVHKENPLMDYMHKLRAIVDNTENKTIVTCVYCGHEYPNGTPASKHLSLTEHIKICEKHPMRVLEEQNKVLKKALHGLVGCDSLEDLNEMELYLRTSIAPDRDKMVAINAIDALRSCE